MLELSFWDFKKGFIVLFVLVSCLAADGCREIPNLGLAHNIALQISLLVPTR